MKGLNALLALVAVALVPVSYVGALVDMRNAGYVDTWNDMILPSSGFDLRVRRTYGSRSLHNGFFGFGWCSDFETSLKITAEGNLKLTECGAGLEILFTPKNFAPGEMEKSVDQIITQLKTKDRNLTGKALAQLRVDLLKDEKRRTAIASDVGIHPAVKEKSVFYANGREVDTIIFKEGFYVRSLADGTSQKFDREGRLAFLYDKNSNYLKFIYGGALLKEVQDNNGRRLSFKFNPNTKKVLEIVGPGNLTSSYAYKGDDLIAIKNAWGNRYTYSYSDTHNITRINFPDSTFKALTYNEDKDWVTSFTDRYKCVETYTYESSADDPVNHYTSKMEKKCKGEVTNFAKYEFWHKERKDGMGQILYRVKGDTKTENIDITYHEIFGRPLIVQRNGNVVNYAYYPNGLVEAKTSKYQVLKFEYDKNLKKISEVKSQFKDENGKIVRTRVTTFKYDEKSNLIYASNTDGQKVWLKYDPRGRIATIRDQARKVVEISYEDRFGKPSIVNRPGLGTIVVTYNSEGQIDKVDSKQGPTVAVQVASTFNNLLEVISPANTEQNI